MDHAKRLEIVEAENDELRERIAQLQELLGFHETTPIEWRLTPSEAAVVGFLLKRPMASKDEILSALYSLRPDDPPAVKIVDVFVCKIRKKIKPFGVEIETVWGQGYRICSETRERLAKEKGLI
ncbi:winged helix-turn-helix domain-containing protein [Methylopila sp. M107]|uniref:helix-turn-helix domain-containing protein n=1 Tax=Methylopila sp. M107 TaxID=1101190 RepID=UPI000372CF35|nr:winged helix-turn-helix domain-containing protein [Methylopila sp. M107]